MKPLDIRAVMERHAAWLRGEPDGEHADLRGADLRGADLRRAVLRNADLSWADLRGADLSWAVLRGANLSGAVLSNADLRGADLRGADLRNADLSWADLRGADLSWAVLRGANLSWAVLDYRVLCLGPIGSRGDYLVYKAGLDEAMTGCWRGTLAAFEAAVAETHGDNQHGRDYTAAIAFIRAVVAKGE